TASGARATTVGCVGATSATGVGGGTGSVVSGAAIGGSTLGGGEVAVSCCTTILGSGQPRSNFLLTATPNAPSASSVTAVTSTRRDLDTRFCGANAANSGGAGA